MDIKKIIREEFELFNNELNIETPFSWLVDNFGELEELPPNEYGQVYYVDSDGRPLFYYYQGDETGEIWINYWRIWSKLEEDFGLNYDEIQGVIKEWLGETYNLTGFTPLRQTSILHKKFWERPII